MQCEQETPEVMDTGEKNTLQSYNGSKSEECTDDEKIITVPYEDFNHVLLLGEADFSFARAFAQELSTTTTDTNRPQITATEYGDGIDIANRYFNGDKQILSERMNYLLQFDSVKEIICGLNARQLGFADPRIGIKRRRNPNPNPNSNNDQNKEEIERQKEDKRIGCTCQRWDVNLNDWGDFSPFWMTNNRTLSNDAKCDDHSKTYDLIIFNFPHSDQAGRATKLVRALFKQIRICINDGKLPKDVVLEMRLRAITKNPKEKRRIRSFYNHEESAEESGFACVGCWSGDLQRWEKWGYQHKRTSKNETCLDIGVHCKVWRWRLI